MSITNPDKISLYKDLHQTNPEYGSSSLKFIEEISLIIDYLAVKSILDYGCGKGVLIERLQELYPEISCYRYDPSIPQFEKVPVTTVDLIINTDVLEHIPETDIPDVLQHMASLSKHVYFNLHHDKAAAVLPSGENAHCTIKSRRWYRKMLQKHLGHCTQLPGRHMVASVALTFPIPVSIKDRYYEITWPARSENPWLRRTKHQVLNKIWDYTGYDLKPYIKLRRHRAI